MSKVIMQNGKMGCKYIQFISHTTDTKKIKIKMHII